MSDAPANLNIKQVCDFLQLSNSTIDRLVRDQKISSTKIGRTRLFPQEEVCRAYSAKFLTSRRLQPGEAMQIAKRALDDFFVSLCAHRASAVNPLSRSDSSSRLTDLERRVAHLEKALEIGIVELVTGKAA